MPAKSRGPAFVLSFPEADKQEVERRLAHRLALKQQLEIGS
jgi:hypothetical protein